MYIYLTLLSIRPILIMKKNKFEKKKIWKKKNFNNFLKDLQESQYERNSHDKLEGSEGLWVILNLTLRIGYLRT